MWTVVQNVCTAMWRYIMRNPCFWAVITVIVMWMAFFMTMVGAHTVSLHPNTAENNHLWDVRIFVVYGLGCIISTAFLYSDRYLAFWRRVVFTCALFAHSTALFSLRTIPGENAIPLMELAIFVLSGVVLALEGLAIIISSASAEDKRQNIEREDREEISDASY